MQRQLVAAGQVLGRYGDAAPTLRSGNVGSAAVSYTVVGGETLKDVARTVLGDASLWWRIADANGLTLASDAALQAGQTLSVPKLALNTNNQDSLQPYDPSRITGSLDPALPMPGNGDLPLMAPPRTSPAPPAP
ncbi:LysM peptidoglycan-binding domain-containing protein [Ottowia sp.]|uniref:LysM peptidoglycan-binding domain-containing protein n=2 Tax=Ottowia sp. TaxID=1898956 RepID=UPI001D66F569|nr:LysM peptidoglycan-binding domain-containing protein [Rhodoferax sp.]MCB2025109.1 LysM peptidoglycan-binding domain-containing protein [Ottowia sp.]MCB2032312.1 LysM peptidoglycan-binding domain-containing protein [Ottowia sp.]MCP5256498.1 LysM peptidoglycan-binding domain-containing protein [Burkholderiaceae bacterium]